MERRIVEMDGRVEIPPAQTPLWNDLVEISTLICLVSPLLPAEREEGGVRLGSARVFNNRLNREKEEEK